MEKGRIVVGVLASHDDEGRNEALANVLDYLADREPATARRFYFVFTKGTYDRVVLGKNERARQLRDKTRSMLRECGVFRLPCRKHGGVVLLASMVVKRQIDVLWSFLTPTTPHWLIPENIALLRLCDNIHVTRLMNEDTVIEWVRMQSQQVKNEPFARPTAPVLYAGGIADSDKPALKVPQAPKDDCIAIDWDVLRVTVRNTSERTLALVAHDDMKARIIDFVMDHERELKGFDRIITTGTTGSHVKEASPSLSERVRRYRSGPKGGDIEIAAEMIFKRCSVAIFLVDTLHAHPHIEDIRVLIGAAILNRVRLLTNERQARDWMRQSDGLIDPCKEFWEWVRDNPSAGVSR